MKPPMRKPSVPSLTMENALVSGLAGAQKRMQDIAQPKPKAVPKPPATKGEYAGNVAKKPSKSKGY